MATPPHDAPTDPEDARFLAMLDDRESLQVYADSLEERGDTMRAEVLRLEYVLRGSAADDDRSAAAIRMIALARKLDPAWCAAIARSPVSGSAWAGKSGNEDFVVRFLPDGAVNYHYGRGGTSYQNATWIQVGHAVAIETNRHYADYEGALALDGARIAGIARNITGARWPWSVDRTQDPELVQIPANVVTTVFEHSGPKVPAGPDDAPTTKRKPSPKKKAAKPPAKEPARAKAKPAAANKARPKAGAKQARPKAGAKQAARPKAGAKQARPKAGAKQARQPKAGAKQPKAGTKPAAKQRTT